MIGIGKVVMALGALVLLAGFCLWGLGKVGFRGLPGDIRYESDGMRIYLPIMTCLVLSVLATGALWLWHWLGRK